MKVGTLACILGAWAEKKSAKKGLDIGTGTGLLALMLAQKNSLLNIDAVELDSAASAQALDNFSNSPWNDRITLHNQDILDFQATYEYDLIISNPPFFEDQYLSPDNRINQARHSSSLTLAQLIGTVNHLLSDEGSFYLLLPPDEFGRAEQHFSDAGLFRKSRLDILNFEDKSAKAIASEWTYKKEKVLRQQLVIRMSDNRFTDEYKSMLSPFYLHF
jgi:tRNA1Val (adenine37-N6)-methyltransferase